MLLRLLEKCKTAFELSYHIPACGFTDLHELRAEVLNKLNHVAEAMAGRKRADFNISELDSITYTFT